MKFVLPILTLLFSVISVFAQDVAYSPSKAAIPSRATATPTSPNAVTGLIAGTDSLAIPIPVTLPATLHYSNMSHCNVPVALGAAIQYSTNGGATWSTPTIINGGANHASLWQGTVTMKIVAGKLVISCAGSVSSPGASFYTTTWVLNAPNAAITHVKLGTAMTSPAGLKLDGGGVYVLE